MLIYPSNDTIIRIYDNEKPNEILNIKRLSELKYVFGYIVILPSYRFNSSFPTCSVIPTKDVLIPNAINKYIGGGVLAYKTDLSLSAVSCTRQGLSASEPQRSASRALAQGLNESSALAEDLPLTEDKKEKLDKTEVLDFLKDKKEIKILEKENHISVSGKGTFLITQNLKDMGFIWKPDKKIWVLEISK